MFKILAPITVFFAYLFYRTPTFAISDLLANVVIFLAENKAIDVQAN